MGIFSSLFGPSVYERIIMAKLDDLIARVDQNTALVDSAAELIRGLRQEIIDAGTDPEKLQALVDKLDESNADLTAALANSSDVVTPVETGDGQDPANPVQGR